MRRQLHTITIILLAGCLAFATACSTTVGGTATPNDPAQQAPGENGGTDLTPPPKRDDAAVNQALINLDACALFDIEYAKSKGNSEVVMVPKGPHSCLMAKGTEYDVTNTTMEVKVGASSDYLLRYWGAPIEIEGARAYEYRNDDPRDRFCRLVLPVNFKLAIEYRYRYSSGDICQVLRSHVGRSVAKLQNPDALAVNHQQRSFSAWDGCSFLKAILGPEAGKYDYKHEGAHDTLSSCQSFILGNPDDRQDIEVNYGIPPEEEMGAEREVFKQIGGKKVQVREFSSQCSLEWSQGPSGTQNKWHRAVVMQLNARNCDSATKLAEQAMTLADKPPTPTAQPQRPILYTPAENDTGRVGACVHLAVLASEECLPYKPLAVPSSPTQILKASDKDSNMMCAIFYDAIRSVFGSEFQPVVWEGHCFFVEPTHTLSIQTNATAVFSTESYRKIGKAQDINIAGKPGLAFGPFHEFDLYISAANNINQPGHIHIGVSAEDGRGMDVAGRDPMKKPQVTPEQVEQAKQVMTQVAQKYFP